MLLRSTLDEDKLFPVRGAFRRARHNMVYSTSNAADWRADCATLLCRSLSVPTAVIVSSARSLRVTAALWGWGTFPHFGWLLCRLQRCVVWCLVAWGVTRSFFC